MRAIVVLFFLTSCAADIFEVDDDIIKQEACSITIGRKAFQKDMNVEINVKITNNDFVDSILPVTK